jgi:hypothetical protein
VLQQLELEDDPSGDAEGTRLELQDGRPADATGDPRSCGVDVGGGDEQGLHAAYATMPRLDPARWLEIPFGTE